MKRQELVVTGTKHIISDLFNVLRFNGIEATIPQLLSGKKYVISCMMGKTLDQILCSWKDFVKCETVTIAE